jgi:hypothetical protein
VKTKNMERININRLGSVSLLAIKNFILDNEIQDDECIVLHPKNFDDIVLEYRETYNESIPVPFIFLNVLVEEDDENRVTFNRIVRSEDNELRRRSVIEKISPGSMYMGIVYRCGYCGDIVNADGSFTSDDFRRVCINLLNKNSLHPSKSVHGKCCAYK